MGADDVPVPPFVIATTPVKSPALKSTSEIVPPEISTPESRSILFISVMTFVTPPEEGGGVYGIGETNTCEYCARILSSNSCNFCAKDDSDTPVYMTLSVTRSVTDRFTTV